MSPIALVTGATHGIGVVTSRELARAGCVVVLLCRNVLRAAAIREYIVRRVPTAEIYIVDCDLASLQAVRACAEVIRRDFGRVNLLINNAGMVSTRHVISEDGFELTFATNHLGHFLLTRLVLDCMDAPGRIINVASRVHYQGTLDLNLITDASARYGSIRAYAQSKLANVLFTFALARRLSGSSVTANCLHPGVVATNLLPRWLQIVKPWISREMFDEDRGARTSLYLALSPEVAQTNGGYFDQYQRLQAASSLANDVNLQELLWHASERWVAGEPYAAPAQSGRVIAATSP